MVNISLTGGINLLILGLFDLICNLSNPFANDRHILELRQPPGQYGNQNRRPKHRAKAKSQPAIKLKHDQPHGRVIYFNKAVLIEPVQLLRQQGNLIVGQTLLVGLGLVHLKTPKAFRV